MLSSAWWWKRSCCIISPNTESQNQIMLYHFPQYRITESQNGREARSLSLRSCLTHNKGFQTSPMFAPERRCHFRGHGNGTNATCENEVSIFLLFTMKNLAISAVPRKLCSSCDYIYMASYYCRKKMHHLILLKVHDSSQQHSET